MRLFPAEFSSKLSLISFKLLSQIHPFSSKHLEDDRLKKELFGLNFPNRIGLAAGLDKEGKYFASLGQLGFGFVEVSNLPLCLNQVISKNKKNKQT